MDEVIRKNCSRAYLIEGKNKKLLKSAIKALEDSGPETNSDFLYDDYSVIIFWKLYHDDKVVNIVDGPIIRDYILRNYSNVYLSLEKGFFGNFIHVSVYRIPKFARIKV